MHISDFAEHHKRPEVGDRVTFYFGVDHQGRRCATGARHVNDGGRITKESIGLLMLLLILPAIAIFRFSFDWRWIGGYFAVINILTYVTYVFDKYRARTKGWRIPEQRMHVLEFLGGWPAGFLAQRQFRHKCSKGSYQAIFWIIVVIYQWMAFDSINSWHYSRALWTSCREFLRSHTTS